MEVNQSVETIKMAENISFVSIRLEFCEGENPNGTVCMELEYEYFMIATQVIALLSNVLHYLVLRKVGKDTDASGRAFITFMQHLCGADLLIALLLILYVNCEIRKLILVSDPLFAAAVFSTKTVAVYRYFILMLSSYERYLAVCRPLNYSQNWILSHIHLCCGCSLLTVLGIAVTRDYVLSVEFCILRVSGVEAANRNGSIVNMGLPAIPLIATFALSMKVVATLRARQKLMDQRRGAEQRRIRVFRGVTRFILINNLLCFVCLIPSLVTFSILPAIGLYSFVSTYFSLLVFSLNSGFNNLLMISMNKKYRQRLRSFLVINSICRKVTVEPIPGNSLASRSALSGTDLERY